MEKVLGLQGAAKDDGQPLGFQPVTPRPVTQEHADTSALARALVETEDALAVTSGDREAAERAAEALWVALRDVAAYAQSLRPENAALPDNVVAALQTLTAHSEYAPGEPETTE